MYTDSHGKAAPTVHPGGIVPIGYMGHALTPLPQILKPPVFTQVTRITLAHPTNLLPGPTSVKPPGPLHSTR